MSTNSQTTNTKTEKLEVRWIMKRGFDFAYSFLPVAKEAVGAYMDYGSEELALERHREWVLGFLTSYESLQFPYLVELTVIRPSDIPEFPDSRKGKKKLRKFFENSCITCTDCTPLTDAAKALIEAGDDKGALELMLIDKGGI